MLGNESSDFSHYQHRPEEKVMIARNGKLRPARISEGGGYFSSSKGTVCYSGRYLDNEKECFIEIPEVLIISSKEK